MSEDNLMEPEPSSGQEKSDTADTIVRVDHDVLTRLDSLLSNNGEDPTVPMELMKMPETNVLPQGILKKASCGQPCQNLSTRYLLLLYSAQNKISFSRGEA